MKIEVCELMLSSWLKNIKGCQLIQTNWVPSTFYDVNDNRLANYSEFISAIKELTDGEEIDIFKKSNDAQLIKQTEIDVVGVKLSEERAQEVYLVDTAFHESGLNYKDNTARIIKKIIRAVGVADLYFTNIPAYIMFVSPFIRESNKENLFSKYNEISEWISLYYPNFKVIMLFNENFAKEIYYPLLGRINNINDSNDLFMRYEKLESLCKSFTVNMDSDLIDNEVNYTELNYNNHTTTNKKANPGDNLKVVFDLLHKLVKSGKMDNYISFLQDANYSKKNFKQSMYPFLLDYEMFEKTKFERKRFYKDLFTYKGKNYLVCSQWIPEKIKMLEEWRNKVL